jgi:hypothetical protein
MLTKDYYGEGECPECHGDIPDDAKIGDTCECGNHTFTNTFKKTTIGFVVQDYETDKDGNHICTGQEFIAGEVSYESTAYGDGLDDVDTDKEVDCPINVIQPEKEKCYRLVNDHDANVEDDIEATTEEEATIEAFSMLGWHLVAEDLEDDS